MNNLFHPTYSNGCYYLSLVGLKLSHVNKRAPGVTRFISNAVDMSHKKMFIRTEFELCNAHLPYMAKTCKLCNQTQQRCMGDYLSMPSQYWDILSSKRAITTSQLWRNICAEPMRDGVTLARAKTLWILSTHIAGPEQCELYHRNTIKTLEHTKIQFRCLTLLMLTFHLMVNVDFLALHHFREDCNFGRIWLGVWELSVTNLSIRNCVIYQCN